jgi:hypothetical protein
METIMRRRVVASVVAAVSLAGVAAIAAQALSGAEAATGSDALVASAARYSVFPTYSVGKDFEGMPLLDAQSVSLDYPISAPEALPPGAGGEYFRFIYGSCKPDGPSDEAGCLPPLEVQVWPACKRSRALFTKYNDGSGGAGALPKGVTDSTARGVPALRAPMSANSFATEVYTGGVTVVVFSTSAAQGDRAVSALTAANGLAVGSAGDPLPAPATGHLAGRAACPS